MPTQVSPRYMHRWEFRIVATVVVAMFLSFGWMLAYQIGVQDGRAMPAPVHLIPASDLAKYAFAGTIGEECDPPKWTEVSLFVDYGRMLSDRRTDTEESLTVQFLRPGV